jgi:hypothetical protein
MKRFIHVQLIASFIFGAMLVNSSLAQPHSFAIPRGIYVLGNDSRQGINIRNYPFVTGYVLRMSWAEIEKSPGVYDFSVIDSIIGKLDSIGQKLTIILGGANSIEPSYIAATAGVTTYVDKYPTGATAIRAVPWDPFLIKRFRAFTKALGDHLVPSAAAGGKLVPLRNHPVLTNINFGIAGLGEIRDSSVVIASIPRYTLQNIINAVIQSLHAQQISFQISLLWLGSGRSSTLFHHLSSGRLFSQRFSTSLTVSIIQGLAFGRRILQPVRILRQV